MKKIISLVILAGSCSFANAQSRDSLYQTYGKLAATNPAALKTELYKKLQSKNEEDWQLAANFFLQLKEKAVADSVTAAEKVRFPDGFVFRSEALQTLFNEKDPVRKEALYNELMKKFAPARFGKDHIIYDYARNAVARAYADADSVKKAVHYALLTETGAWKGEGYAGIAAPLAAKGHTKEAEMLLRKAVAVSYAYKIAKKQDNAAKFAATGYRGYTRSLAGLLYNDKQYKEALGYADSSRKAYNATGEVNGAVLGLEAKIYEALGKDKEAFAMIDEAVRAGQATPDMKTSLKTLYAKVKGPDGYDAYIAEVNKQLAVKIRKDLAKQMINTPAPDFTLTDLDGKTVSLSDLKGKTVVVDFWATWCGPCKASLPIMKQAVEKYAADKDVQFVFIHTWEHDDNATELARKFISDNHYPFEVLMDLKNPTTGENKAVTDFKVSAIPTKFVIDKNGDIRFRFTGFSGGADAALEEISAMISLAKG
jgi:thiol-disulfide isomerase/thioredoxin